MYAWETVKCYRCVEQQENCCHDWRLSRIPSLSLSLSHSCWSVILFSYLFYSLSLGALFKRKTNFANFHKFVVLLISFMSLLPFRLPHKWYNLIPFCLSLYSCLPCLQHSVYSSSNCICNTYWDVSMKLRKKESLSERETFAQSSFRLVMCVFDYDRISSTMRRCLVWSEIEKWEFQSSLVEREGISMECVDSVNDLISLRTPW